MITIKQFSARSGFSVEELTGRGRKGQLCSARQMFWKMLHESGTERSDIGRMFGRTVATIYSGINRINDLIEAGDKFSLSLQNIATATISDKEEKLIGRWIAEMERSGYTYDEMIRIIRLASEKFDEMKNNN